MIKNLVVSGCSFTEYKDEFDSWANIVAKHYQVEEYVNLAKSGAGNYYICNSIIDYLEEYQLSPSTTLILVMWSGIGRRDARISGDFYYSLENYNYKTKNNDATDGYYIFSGGMSNSWLNHPLAKNFFWEQYKASDPFVECKYSLEQFTRLTDYTNSRGFLYKCTSFVNYWRPDAESVDMGMYSLGHFSRDMPMYKNFNFSPWFFTDSKRNCFYEFAKDQGLIGQDGYHPDAQAHKLFANNIVIPNVDNYCCR